MTILHNMLEYGMGSQVSMQGDLYSFGIIILELLTGRRPTDEMFKDSRNLHNYVKTTFQANLVHIVDPNLVRRRVCRDEENTKSFPFIHPSEEKCLVSLFEVGLACSVESPQERMNVVDDMKKLNHIRMVFSRGWDE